MVAVALALPVLASAQPTPDHLACYRAKDAARKGQFSLTVTNAGATQTCTAKLPARLACVESAKSNVVPQPPGGGPTVGAAGNFLCYQLKCPKPFPPDFQMTDQLGGQRVVKFRGAQMLCVPATRGPETFTSSTTTSTTVPGPCDFNSNTRKCEGTCGNGGTCSAVASGGACECRTTACGDASAPECDGFCKPDEACIFDLTGCSCQSIP
jgi:hypothetical protein